MLPIYLRTNNVNVRPYRENLWAYVDDACRVFPNVPLLTTFLRRFSKERKAQLCKCKHSLQIQC